jgi:SAM-dependent methyltransferase
VSGFTAGEQRWIEGLEKLRTVVRQEVISRQIAPFVGPGRTVLDVGCGQGTQALRLAASGCQVTGVDPSPRLRSLGARDARSAGLDVELIHGGIEDLGEVCGGRTFDLVCCHGVMMYLGARTDALGSLADRVAIDGRLSVTFRNGHAMAMRPGLRGDWAAALSAFDSTNYVNELGLPATADRLDGIRVALDAARMQIDAWYGVRVFTDAEAPDVDPPSADALDRLLDAEERAGATDPYRWVASQLHVIAKGAH